MPWTDRYVRSDASGSGTGLTDTPSDAWTLPQVITNIGTGAATDDWRINIRGGVYSFGSTSYSFSINSSATSSKKVWWRGFATIPGDLDSTPVIPNQTWTGPDIRFTTGAASLNGLNSVLSNIRIITTSGASTTLNMSPANIGFEPIIVRCWLENQGTGIALTIGQVGGPHRIRAYGCYLKASASVARVIAVSVSSAVHSCIIDGGVHGYTSGGSGGVSASFYNCIFRNQSGSCIFHNGVSSTTSFIALNNIFYKPGSHGIAFNPTAPPQNIMPVMNNVFIGCGGYGISSTDNTTLSSSYAASIIRIGNKFFGNVSGNGNFLGEYQGHENVQLAENPFVDGDNWDFRLKSSSLSNMYGFPYVFTGPATQVSNDYSGPYKASASSGGGSYSPIDNLLIG
jgi:hypothetical protein